MARAALAAEASELRSDAASVAGRNVLARIIANLKMTKGAPIFRRRSSR
jgi:hypothetical protein